MSSTTRPKWLSASFAAAATLVALAASSTLSQPPLVAPKTRALVPHILSTARMTRFNPETQGFRFTNRFLNVTGVFDITTGGLCGGMAYAVLDYFNRGIPVPKQTYVPVPGTQLESYIYGRQMDALSAHMDKWVELHANPGGARDNEFFRWGLQGTNGGRLQELRAHIDAGKPVPLGLKSLSGDPGADHVVLAYGYDMGRYKGDLGPNQQDLKIFIYEPNYGAQKVTLVPRPASHSWCYLEPNGAGDIPCWRTYFVQQNYHVGNPPRIPAAPVELVLDIKTGSDDLRGGNDNLSLEVTLTDGRRITAGNVNRGRRWIDHSWNHVGVTLPDSVRSGQVRDVLLRTSFGGGFGGDNWNIDEITAKLRINGADQQHCTREGNPVFRFTGDRRHYSMPVSC